LSATAPLDGLRVVDLSTTLPGALATQFLADAGAEVIQVEAPGGSPLRALPGWPGLGRGKRSAVLDLATERDRLDDLLAGADVLVTTMSPAALRRQRLTDLGERFPRLVAAAITGWGPTGPWADLPGYEGLVMAKLGSFHTKRRMVTRKGPAFVSVPYASWGAAHGAVQGILAALLERERSGRGQHVDADLVRGVTTLDTWNWFTELVGVRWPGAYEVVDAFTDDGEPMGAMIYALLVAPTRDGHWLQFAQLQPRLFLAMLTELGLSDLLTDPRWKGLPALETQELRTELWELMLARASKRTLAEWEEVFARNPDISAEVYRSGPEALSHPQLLHDGRVLVVEDPDLGPVRQPSTLVHSDGRPLRELAPAPRLDEHGAQPLSPVAPASVPPADSPARLPLEGVTVLEFGVMFAGPYASALLADLGARVIKIESLDGDSMRTVVPFPEAGAAKAMQGKESVAVDLGTPEGREVVHALAARADVVLQSFRAGAAARAGIDRETLLALNPDLVYVNAPGYGTDGPYGTRPAYAPSVGAAVGLALTDAPDARGATGSMAEIKCTALRLNQATAVPSMQADGVAALGVASTMLLGLLARARGRALGELTTTMLAAGTHALFDRVVDYPGRPEPVTADDETLGYAATYRLYRAAEGWVFLAVPADREWAALVARPEFAALGARFGTAESRAEHDAELTEALAAVFAGRPAQEWEAALVPAGIGCVRVTEITPELHLQTDEALAATYCATAESPIFQEYLRLGPLTTLSRSGASLRGGCLLGEHTEQVLAELGYDEEKIQELRDHKVI
jgi:crotonobetainyl-CoA:carnitine CoA-transferase CaiB-like acyl-CoA transferase